MDEPLDPLDDDPDRVWALLAELDGRAVGTAPVDTAALAPVAETVGRWLAERDVDPAALRRPGLVALTRTHLDVVLDIETIDITVRRAGLDRDPGWVPTLQRIVSFHFVDGPAR